MSEASSVLLALVFVVVGMGAFKMFHPALRDSCHDCVYVENRTEDNRVLHGNKCITGDMVTRLYCRKMGDYLLNDRPCRLYREPLI